MKPFRTEPFRYADGALRAESVDLAALAAEVGTPFYCYSRAATAVGSWPPAPNASASSSSTTT